MKYKKFQIKNSSACLYKWAWSTIYLANGTTNSCHRVGGWLLNDIDFKDFHNHPGKIHDRKLMLEGEWPSNNCEYCKKVEDVGGISERIGWVNDSEVLPPEMEDDPTALYVTPRILEIYFSNICNQSCAYCSPIFSSVIEQEIKRFGPLSDRYRLNGTWETDPNYEKNKEALWQWMHKNSQHLYNFNVLGGEPLFQKEFFECLEFFETHYNPNLIWKMFTNLKHDLGEFKKKIDRMVRLIREKKLKGIEVVCSIDCWGKEQEYARHGMSLENWEKNFDYLLSIPEIDVTIQSTISPITLPTSWELAKKVQEWNNIRYVGQGWNNIANPPFLDPSIFGTYLVDYMNQLINVVYDKLNKDEEALQTIVAALEKIKASKYNYNRSLDMLIKQITAMNAKIDQQVESITQFQDQFTNLDLSNYTVEYIINEVNYLHVPYEYNRNFLTEVISSLLSHKEEDITQLLNSKIKELQSKIESSKNSHSYMLGFRDHIQNTPVNKELLHELKNYLDELDRRRGLDWKSIYPWMSEIFQKELKPITKPGRV